MMASPIPDVSTIYQRRFQNSGLARRDRVWKVLCSDFFNSRLIPSGSVLDLACGYGEFINNAVVKYKYAVDMNPDAATHLLPEIKFKQTPADNLSHIPENTFDRVFTSNFLEHLPSKQVCDAVLREVLRVLKPGGHFIILGPNIRFAYREYWDFYDHYLPLSHLALAEGLIMNGYRIVENIDRFLPYTMAGRQPTSDIVLRLYLTLRPAWKIFDKQFLITAEKPS